MNRQKAPEYFAAGLAAGFILGAFPPASADDETTAIIDAVVETARTVHCVVDCVDWEAFRAERAAKGSRCVTDDAARAAAKAAVVDDPGEARIQVAAIYGYYCIDGSALIKAAREAEKAAEEVARRSRALAAGVVGATGTVFSSYAGGEWDAQEDAAYGVDGYESVYAAAHRAVEAAKALDAEAEAARRVSEIAFESALNIFVSEIDLSKGDYDPHGPGWAAVSVSGSVAAEHASESIEGHVLVAERTLELARVLAFESARNRAGYGDDAEAAGYAAVASIGDQPGEGELAVEVFKAAYDSEPLSDFVAAWPREKTAVLAAAAAEVEIRASLAAEAVEIFIAKSRIGTMTAGD